MKNTNNGVKYTQMCTFALMEWRQEYLERLNAADPSDDEIKAILDLKKANLPKLLYKYREPNDYAINGLLNDTVWVCSPKRYTDTNEFIEKINTTEYLKAMRELVDKEIALAKEGRNTLPIDILKAMKRGKFRMKVASCFISRSLKEKIQAVGDKVLGNLMIERHRLLIHDIQNKMKVCSFCEVPDSIEMWKDYALQSTGFCIEFNISLWPLNEIRRTLLHPVVYSDDLYNSTHHHIQSVFGRFNPFYPIVSGTRKQKQYKYEQEWRFIIPAGGAFEEQEYSMNCQSKVFLGSEMTPDYKARVVDICKQKRLAVYQVLSSIEKHKFEFERVNI